MNLSSNQSPQSNSPAPNNTAIWPKGKEGLATYESCFRRALRRMAIALNSHRDRPICARSWRKLTDTAIERKFQHKRLDQLLVRFMCRSADRNADDDEIAEHYFYGWFNFLRRETPIKHVVVEYTTTAPFLSWSYDGLEWPPFGGNDIGRNKFGTDAEFIEACATNYLLKNFWHNFVHCEIQGIDFNNYHRLRGNARYESDFEADNLATIFLVASYGLPITGGGRLSTNKGDEINRLLHRNICNRVFALRAVTRSADVTKRTEADDWEETEWRYRRSLASQLGGWLVSRGCAVTSLGIYFAGPVRQGRDGFFRSGEVIVAVNGRRIPTKVPPYIPVKRPRTFERKREEHHQRIATTVYNEYKAKLDSDRFFRGYCTNAIASVFERAGVAPP